MCKVQTNEHEANIAGFPTISIVKEATDAMDIRLVLNMQRTLCCLRYEQGYYAIGRNVMIDQCEGWLVGTLCM
jgi:hypothetical protein